MLSVCAHHSGRASASYRWSAGSSETDVALVAGVHGLGHDLHGCRHDLPQAVGVEVHRLQSGKVASIHAEVILCFVHEMRCVTQQLDAAAASEVYNVPAPDLSCIRTPASIYQYQVLEVACIAGTEQLSGGTGTRSMVMPWETARQ